MSVRIRIAPSPTGYPHIGTIYQAWLDSVYAEKHGGTFIVRIEDTDRDRFVADAEAKLYEALDWFGIAEDESPRKGGEFGPYRQSERLQTYRNHIQALLKAGQAYYCFCSQERLDQVRKEMQAQGKIPMYDKQCRNLNQAELVQKLGDREPYVIRLKVPENQTIVFNDLIRGEIKFESNGIDDQVLIKSDGFPTYHFAVVVDDHLMEITHVVRGEEWLPSSPKHILLYQMLGWQPPIFIHTPTLRNPDKSKLSKRQGHTNVSWYQEKGFLPEAVLNYLCELGWTHPEQKDIYSKDEFMKLFDFKDLSPAGPVFDETKLRWLNGKYIRTLSDQDLMTKLKPFVFLGTTDEVLLKAIPLVKERLEVLSDINDLLKFLKSDLLVGVEEVLKQSKQPKEEVKRLLTATVQLLTQDKYWNVTTSQAEGLHQDFIALKAQFEAFSNREYFMTIRVATTGFPVTPPLFESIELLGKKLVLKRLGQVIGQI